MAKAATVFGIEEHDVKLTPSTARLARIRTGIFFIGEKVVQFLWGSNVSNVTASRDYENPAGREHACTCLEVDRCIKPDNGRNMNPCRRYVNFKL